MYICTKCLYSGALQRPYTEGFHEALGGFAHTDRPHKAHRSSKHMGGLHTHILIFPIDMGVLHKAPTQRRLHRGPRGFEYTVRVS